MEKLSDFIIALVLLIGIFSVLAFLVNVMLVHFIENMSLSLALPVYLSVLVTT